MLLFGEDLLELWRRRSISFWAIMILSTNLVIEILYFFEHILSFGFVFDFLLLFVCEFGRIRRSKWQWLWVLDEWIGTSGSNKEPLSKDYATFSIGCKAYLLVCCYLFDDASKFFKYFIMFYWFRLSWIYFYFIRLCSSAYSLIGFAFFNESFLVASLNDFFVASFLLIK